MLPSLVVVECVKCYEAMSSTPLTMLDLQHLVLLATCRQGSVWKSRF